MTALLSPVQSACRFGVNQPVRIGLSPEDAELKRLQAFAVRWTQSQPAVAAFISTMVPRYHDAEDILQRTAAALVAMRDQYDSARPFVSWAIGVARMEVLRYRQEVRRSKAVFDTETVEAIAEAMVRVEPDMGEMKVALDRCMAKLTGRVKQVFELHYLQSLSPSEIAHRLGRGTNAIFLALHRGRLSLRKCMERSLGGSTL